MLYSGDTAYRSRHHQVGLRVEVTAEDVVTVTLQRLQTLPLRRQTDVYIDTACLINGYLKLNPLF